MNHIAAALLLSLAGKNVDEKGITSVLESAGSKPNKFVLDALLNATKGKKPD